MKRIFVALGLSVIALLSGFCLRSLSITDRVGDGPVPVKNEVVMSPGMKITATTVNGTITIAAGNGLKRSYSWEGATRSVEMLPRKSRWYGSLGLYFPGPGEHWKGHNGITRCVAEEGQQHFKTDEEALQWMADRGKNWMPYSYRDDGLVVGWQKNPSRKQLNVEVWQLYVGGKKPDWLTGSRTDDISVEYAAQKPEQP